MELTEKQKQILNSPYKKVAVRAAAASGKTTILTEKVRQLLQTRVDPSTIAVITYTRMAAANLIERLGNDYKDGIYIGTVHSLAAHFLSKYGRSNLIARAAEDEDFDKLFLECQNFYLKNEYSWVLLDEGQDSSPHQLEFIFDMLAPENIFVVYDDRQCIYEEKNRLDNYIKRDKLYVYQMDENYRNSPMILNFAKKQLKGSSLTDSSTARNLIPGAVWQELYTYDFFKAIPENEYGKWAILAPTNQDLNYLKTQLEKLNIPYVTFRQGDITKDELNKLMNENTVKLLTIHSSKGLEWDNVIVYDVSHWMLYKSWNSVALRYVAATRAKTKLYWLKK